MKFADRRTDTSSLCVYLYALNSWEVAPVLTFNSVANELFFKGWKIEKGDKMELTISVTC
jgi:hypothetical protein